MFWSDLWGFLVWPGPGFILSRLNAEFRAFSQKSSLSERSIPRLAPRTPAAFLKSDRERAGQAVKKFNIPRQ
jgi:hypothetical protein